MFFYRKKHTFVFYCFNMTFQLDINTILITALPLLIGSGGIIRWYYSEREKKTKEQNNANIDTIAKGIAKELSGMMSHDVLERLESRIASVEKTIGKQIQSCLTCKAENFKNKLGKSEVTNTINNTIYYLKEKFAFDLVFVLQPHPQAAATHLSVYYEAKREGVQSASIQIKRLPIQSVNKAYTTLCNGDFFIIKSVDNIADDTLRGIVFRMGGRNVICKKLVSECGSVTGFLIGMNTHLHIDNMDIVELEREFNDEAITIQGIVPDIE